MVKPVFDSHGEDESLILDCDLLRVEFLIE